MGYIRHDAIIVTAFDEKDITPAHEWANELGLPVSDIVDSKMNGYLSFLIAPDGSKEGWHESDAGDAARTAWIDRVRAKPDFYIDWVQVSFGGDANAALIIDHADADRTEAQGNEAKPQTITVDYETWVASISVAQHNVDLNACLTRIIRDLPVNRDWLDPDIEKWARQLTGEQSHG